MAKIPILVCTLALVVQQICGAEAAKTETLPTAAERAEALEAALELSLQRELMANLQAQYAAVAQRSDKAHQKAAAVRRRLETKAGCALDTTFAKCEVKK